MSMSIRLFGILICLAGLGTPARGQQPAAMKIPAPELVGIETWVNAKPQSLKNLRGKVVVVHFWAFG